MPLIIQFKLDEYGVSVLDQVIHGPGQFEVNFHHTEDVLDAGDTAMMFRRLVRGVVGSHGGGWSRGCRTPTTSPRESPRRSMRSRLYCRPRSIPDPSTR